MNLIQLKETGLFANDTKIHISKTDGCVNYRLTFDNKVNIGNLFDALIPEVLNKSIKFIEPENNVLVITFEFEYGLGY